MNDKELRGKSLGKNHPRSYHVEKGEYQEGFSEEGIDQRRRDGT